jgi:hypothetical protein
MERSPKMDRRQHSLGSQGVDFPAARCYGLAMGQVPAQVRGSQPGDDHCLSARGLSRILI